MPTPVLKKTPPSYPMRPWQQTADYFRPDASTPTGLKLNVPLQLGKWWFEPVYARSMVFLFNPSTGDKVTRTLNPVNWSAKEEAMLANIAKNFPGDHWLHCVMIHGVENGGTGHSAAIGILDYLDFKDTFEERRATLEKAFQQLGIRLPIQDKFFFLVPKFSDDCLPHLWHALHTINKDAGRPIFTGLVGKLASSCYQSQLNDHKDTSPEWHLHLFDNVGVKNEA